MTIHVDLGTGNSELGRVQTRYPCLAEVPLQGGVALRGTLPIIHNGAEIDAFKIRIDLHRSGLHHWPTVFEIGGRVPRTPERHVQADGSACVGLPEDLLFATLGEPMSLGAFVEGPTRDYFMAQAAFEANRQWPFGERGHGPAGRREFYEELLGTHDIRSIKCYIAVLSEPRIQRQWLCPCGSGQKLRRCHRQQVAALRERVPPRLAGALRTRLLASL